MLKFAAVIAMMSTAWAQGNQPPEKVNLDMCGSSDYRFDLASKECVYCAHGLHYTEDLKCIGTPNVLGKCYGGHHYHAATEECMFCAKGYGFNEKSRRCEVKKK